MCRSPSSPARCGRSSALSGLAAAVYLVVYGAQTPLLALRGLLRLRNLLFILVPAVLLNIAALAIGAAADASISAGALALAAVPAPLFAPEVVGRMRGRLDLAGALAVGTVIVAIVIIAGRGSLAAAGLFTAFELFAVAAMIAGGIPMLRDALLRPLRIAGWVAAVAVPIVAAVSLTRLDTAAVIAAAVLFAVGAGSATALAVIAGRDVRAVVGGSGLRDPVLGIALAGIAAGPDAAAVPLAYAVFCLVLGGIALRAR